LYTELLRLAATMASYVFAIVIALLLIFVTIVHP
jgi:hypothetical protein